MSRRKKHHRPSGYVKPTNPIPPPPPARVLPELPPAPSNIFIGYDLAAPGDRDFSSTAIVDDQGVFHHSPPASQRDSSGCNIVAATAVLIFVAIFIGLILWILSFTPAT